MSVKTQFSNPIDKYWTVTTNERLAYMETRSLGVVAQSADEVVAKVLAHNPKLSIVSINHKGPVDII